MGDTKQFMPAALRLMREHRLRLNQTEAAAKAGVARSQLSDWERGLKLPRLETLLDLLDGWELGLQDLSWALSVAQGGATSAASDVSAETEEQQTIHWIRRQAQETEGRLAARIEFLEKDLNSLDRLSMLFVHKLLERLDVPRDQWADLIREIEQDPDFEGESWRRPGDDVRKPG